MHFSKQPDPVNAIRKYDAESIWVNQQKIEGSVALGPTTIFDHFDCHRVADLSLALLEPLLETSPEVLVIATGASVVFPDAALMREIQHSGVGVEVMNDGAAVRTFNVLLSEQRDIVLALVR